MRELPFRPESVEVLLFDLGGGVIDIDFRRCFAHWADSADRAVEELVSLFTIDAAYEAHERGRLPISEYLEHLRGTLGLALTDDELLAGWNDIWTGANRDIGPLLTVASDAFPLYAFTNSNPTHQAVWSRRFAEPLDTFTATFVSSEICPRHIHGRGARRADCTRRARPRDVCLTDAEAFVRRRGRRQTALLAVRLLTRRARSRRWCRRR